MAIKRDDLKLDGKVYIPEWGAGENMTNFNEGAACAHVQVKYVKIKHSNGMCSDNWVCAHGCGQMFMPIGSPISKGQMADRVMDLREKLAAITCEGCREKHPFMDCNDDRYRENIPYHVDSRYSTYSRCTSKAFELLAALALPAEPPQIYNDPDHPDSELVIDDEPPHRAITVGELRSRVVPRSCPDVNLASGGGAVGAEAQLREGECGLSHPSRWISPLSPYEQCMDILLSSPTYHLHIQPCWCEKCSYIRSNVSEIMVLLSASRISAGASATPAPSEVRTWKGVRFKDSVKASGLAEAIALHFGHDCAEGMEERT